MPSDDDNPLLAQLRAGQTTFVRQGRGSAVILAHGVGMATSFWSGQLAALSAHFNVVAYDLMGHGGSELPSEAVSLADYARQLITLMDDLGVASAHLVGHSMGALVVLETALRHPERVLSVTAMNAVYCRSAEQRSAVESRAKSLSRDDMPDAALERWFGNVNPSAHAGAASLVRHLLTSVDPAGYARTYRLFATSDDAHVGRLAGLESPALFITGECDPNSTPAMSRAMAAIAPLGAAAIIAGERHMMSLTSPMEVNQRLLEFLLTSDRARSSASTHLRGSEA